MSDQVDIPIDDESSSEVQASTNDNDGSPCLDTEDVQLLDALREAKSQFREDVENPAKMQEIVPKEKKRMEICKIPEIMLRNGVDKTNFAPSKFPVGPIHGVNDSPLFEKKPLKVKLAAHFISESGKDEEFLFKKMKTKCEKDIKTYFNENVISSYSDAGLLRLVFLDGCAMLGFIHSYIDQKLSKFNINDDDAKVIQQELFMLENQIPFKVLEVLMGWRREWGKEELRDNFLKFVCDMSNTIFPRDSMAHVEHHFSHYLSNKWYREKPVHILDLFREVILFESFQDRIVRLLSIGRYLFCFPFCIIPILLLYCVSGCFGKSNGPIRHNRPPKYNSYISFRQVQELKTAGVRFMPTGSLKAISFQSLLGIAAQLKLPTLVVDNSTERKLLNLVAYETCLQESHRPNGGLLVTFLKLLGVFDRDPWVTSYVKLLDLLIDNEDDVKDLRKAHILRNYLSTDTDVSRKINGIGSYCIPPSEDTYQKVKENIQKHCNRKRAIWMAQVYHGHFSSPWAILGLFAATTVLVLTAIQTWCAVYKD